MNFFLVTVPAIPTKLKINKEHPMATTVTHAFSNIDEAHGGIDIVAKEGTPINSAASGVVVFSGWTYEMGNLIIIYHGGGYMTHYGHNQNNLVSRLDMVKRGDVIGYVGNTGISSGPHLHWGVTLFGTHVDPQLLAGPMPTK